MQHLGHTRSSWKGSHALLTPDTFVRAPLPGMTNATAMVHAAPVMGAGFTEYSVEFEASGTMAATQEQRFVYVLDGEIRIGDRAMTKDHYAYLPPGDTRAVTASTKAKAIVIEKPYVPLEGEPAALFGDERQLAPHPLMGDDALAVRTMIPTDPAYDMAVNTMTFEPGSSLPMVEIHVMEHGLMMLDGGGIYRLDEDWYPVTAGDFIWMGPYCPQWFGALGKTSARYLIFKDWNRHPLA